MKEVLSNRLYSAYGLWYIFDSGGGMWILQYGDIDKKLIEIINNYVRNTLNDNVAH